jgi:hypothetical protein
MKQFLFALFLLVNAAPLFANDEDGDIAYIPSYQELVREGYGPRDHRQDERYRQGYNLPVTGMAPKPTLAYYGKGYTVYYGYTAVQAHFWDPNLSYAFGRPLDYFRNMMPDSITDTDLDHYAVSVPTQHGLYGPGDFVANAQASHVNAISTVQTTKASANGANSANPLPAIGEKPAR